MDRQRSREQGCPTTRQARRSLTPDVEGRRPACAPGWRGEFASPNTERLAEAGIEPSVGSCGDSYDNALAETVMGLFKTEEIHRNGPWRGLEDVEIATLEWVWWFNERRLMEPRGSLPPAEYEDAFYRRQEAQATEAPPT